VNFKSDLAFTPKPTSYYFPCHLDRKDLFCMGARVCLVARRQLHGYPGGQIKASWAPSTPHLTKSLIKWTNLIISRTIIRVMHWCTCHYIKQPFGTENWKNRGMSNSVLEICFFKKKQLTNAIILQQKSSENPINTLELAHPINTI
jgi:hypothetical protein